MLRFWKKNRFPVHPAILAGVLFVITLGVCTALQVQPSFPDPDSFYHAKFSQLLAQRGASTEFPWLSATSLRYQFVDHHFLYHLLLIPFVSFGDPLWGIKAATAIFAGLMLVAFYFFLRSLQVRGAFWYALFLLTVNPLLFRINLAKAQPLVLAWLFLCLYFLFKRQPLPLLFGAFLYSWLYGGWLVLLGTVVLTVLLTQTRQHPLRQLFSLHRAGRVAGRLNLELLFSAFVGIGLGLLLHPYSPGILEFTWQQAFRIGVVGYQRVIGVGSEWYPYGLLSLVRDAAPFLALLLAGVLSFLAQRKNRSTVSLVLALLTAIFFVMTLRSRRYVEYLMPFGVAFSAVALTGWWEQHAKQFRSVSPRVRRALIALVILLFIPLAWRDGQAVYQQYVAGRPLQTYAPAARWLADHTPEGSIVFHSDWDEFPHLFYYNHHNYYIVGLDPSFLYIQNPELHRLYVAVTTGVRSEQLSAIIHSAFGASYVFVDRKDNAAFGYNLATDKQFELVYEDAQARVYQVKP